MATEPMLTEPMVTDEEIRDLAASGKPYSLLILRWTADRHREDAASIELEHQRRMVTLRRDGVIAILCPVLSDAVAGVAVTTVTAEQAHELFAEDPCIRAGMMTHETYPCVSFPGDSLPG